MIVLKENQRLYLHSCNYNMARMMSVLASLVKEHGGRVKPTRQAFISDRNCKDAEPIKVTHTSVSYTHLLCTLPLYITCVICYSLTTGTATRPTGYPHRKEGLQLGRYIHRRRIPRVYPC